MKSIPVTRGLESHQVKKQTNKEWQALRRESAAACTLEVMRGSFNGQGASDTGYSVWGSRS